MTSTHLDAPAAGTCPLGHTVQFVAPDDEEKVPAGHGVQNSESPKEKEPALQGRHIPVAE